MCRRTLDNSTVGADLTVITAVPVWPSLVAAIVAVPGPTALTVSTCRGVGSCGGDTVATAGSLLAHVTDRPVRK